VDNGEVIGYYDKRAQQLDDAYRGEPPQWVREMVADMQAALRGRRVLEVACGSGHWTCFAARSAAHVTGVDAAPRMVPAQQRLDPDEGEVIKVVDRHGIIAQIDILHVAARFLRPAFSTTVSRARSFPPAAVATARSSF